MASPNPESAGHKTPKNKVPTWLRNLERELYLETPSAWEEKLHEPAFLPSPSPLPKFRRPLQAVSTNIMPLGRTRSEARAARLLKSGTADERLDTFIAEQHTMPRAQENKDDYAKSSMKLAKNSAEQKDVVEGMTSEIQELTLRDDLSTSDHSGNHHEVTGDVDRGRPLQKVSLNMDKAPQFPRPKISRSNSPTKSSYTTSSISRDIRSGAHDSQSLSISTKKRTKSPIKSLAALFCLPKSVTYGQLDLSRVDIIPEDIRGLCNDLKAICSGQMTIPTAMSREIGTELPENMFYQADDRSDRQQYSEFENLARISKHTSILSNRGSHESEWYDRVIYPVLDVAFRRQDHMDPCNVSQARLIPDFTPNIGSDNTGSRMVDYAVNVILDQVHKKTISRWLASQPEQHRTVNQSLCDALMCNPTCISIEVKCNAANDTAKIQLAIWVSAWHARISRLPSSIDEDNQSKRIISLPLIIVNGPSWTLFFAIDQGDSIDILQYPLAIGTTTLVEETYKIIAVLRRLGTWAKDFFVPWCVDAYGFDVTPDSSQSHNAK